ncbi:hypothetical protein C8P63_107131 [Melghirimyces profundicolus]|uniref:Uncharacterized protein n=1 Tax=Melghirimyces profundicolus TaxID=1242148 RepID=A0A2T6BZ61_9BACL|nr:hypothetical protein [Melghirimyces profundicolus]PTX61336.1 hypothetical protein C8P63_107131 [Melghirimyces profundicolus]
MRTQQKLPPVRFKESKSGQDSYYIWLDEGSHLNNPMIFIQREGTMWSLFQICVFREGKNVIGDIVEITQGITSEQKARRYAKEILLSMCEKYERILTPSSIGEDR